MGLRRCGDGGREGEGERERERRHRGVGRCVSVAWAGEGVWSRFEFVSR